MAEVKNLSTKEKILRAEEAYRRFFDVMENLTQRQKMVVAKAIQKIDAGQIDKIRKSLNLN
jgi:hypothetical protein